MHASDVGSPAKTTNRGMDKLTPFDGAKASTSFTVLLKL